MLLRSFIIPNGLVSKIHCLWLFGSDTEFHGHKVVCRVYAVPECQTKPTLGTVKELKKAMQGPATLCRMLMATLPVSSWCGPRHSTHVARGLMYMCNVTMVTTKTERITQSAERRTVSLFMLR